MRLNKKALSAAITLSLVLGVYGVAGATDSLYGAGTQYSEQTVVEGNATTDSSKAIGQNANYTINSGTWDIAVGGISATANVTGNTVTVKGGEFNFAANPVIVSEYFSSSIVGGMSDQTYESSGNIVNIEGPVKASGEALEIDGGNNAVDGDVIGNTVNIKPGSSLGSDDVKISISGGLSNYGKAEGNIVNITGGIIKNSESQIVGGYVNDGTKDATDNAVNISGGTISGSVYGGYVCKDGNATINKVDISGGTVTGSVYGGYSNGSGAADGNQVNISGGTIIGVVYGGYSYSGAASSNTVTIDGGSVETVYSGYSYSGPANNNKVTIDGGSVETVYGGYSYSGAASSNTVTIDGGTISGEVYGGYVSEGSGAASSNTVTIDGGTIGSSVYGGRSYSGAATGDTVNISGGEITGAVVGGLSSSGNVEGNTVTITGGEITGAVVGGYVSGGSGDAKNNTVNVSGTADLTKAALYGYYTSGTHSGNTLTIESGWTGSVKSIQNFDTVTNNGTLILTEQSKGIGALTSSGTLGFKAVGNTADSATISGTLNFYIPKTAVNGNTMLTVAGTADLTDANVQAGVQTGSKLKKGDSITLIDANKITGTLASATTMTEAGYNKYELGIDVVNNEDLVATVLKAGAGENAKSPLETMAASMSMLNMGGDMLATEGLESAVAAANVGKTESEVFAAIGNSNARVNSGSHVDVNGTTFNLGFAKAIANESGKLVIGPVVEYGTGKYDSYLDNGYHGDGKSKYWGVGLVAKQLNNTGVYYEGSLRGGRVTNDYSAADGSYDSSALYIAAHLGLGRVFKLNEKNNVDVYGKYFFTHQGGDNVEINGDEFDFKNANSNRTRLGARYNYNINAKNTLYGGLAWQYEFSGETAGSMGEDAIEAPSLKGHTGILELGWKVAPTKTFEMKLGMSAYTGVERGGSANIHLNWKF